MTNWKIATAILVVVGALALPTFTSDAMANPDPSCSFYQNGTPGGTNTPSHQSLRRL
jgi:hypothetical protein